MLDKKDLPGSSRADLLEQIIYLVDPGGYIGKIGARDVFGESLIKLYEYKYL